MPILSALTYIIIGLLNCFWGLRLFRIVLVIVGALIGFAIGTSVTADLGQFAALLIGLIAAIIGGLFGYLLYPVGVVIAGAALGIGIASVLGAALNVDNTLVLIILLLGAVIGAGLGLALNKPIIMLSTAIIGGQAIMTGILLLFGSGEITAGSVFSLNAISLIGTGIFAALGFFYQYRDIERSEGEVVLS